MVCTSAALVGQSYNALRQLQCMNTFDKRWPWHSRVQQKHMRYMSTSGPLSLMRTLQRLVNTSDKAMCIAASNLYEWGDAPEWRHRQQPVDDFQEVGYDLDGHLSMNTCCGSIGQLHSDQDHKCELRSNSTNTTHCGCCMGGARTVQTRTHRRRIEIMLKITACSKHNDIR